MVVMAQISPSHWGPISDHYRCSPGLPSLDVSGGLREENGFFRFGKTVCYGQAAGLTQPTFDEPLFDASQQVQCSRSSILLPFDVSQVLDNLRYERYVQQPKNLRWLEQSWAKDIYYRLRPMLPISLRKHLQKLYLRDWDAIAFPAWPVDRSVDILFERLLALAMRVLQIDQVPFIWFWPESHKGCAIMTHDVETKAGRDFSHRLMDIDDAFGIKASFQIVPEKRYDVPTSYLEMIRSRGCEINVHGLDHDGNLFENREAFLECAKKINHYGELFGSRGFRSPILYRNLDWLQELNFSYDMSVPNVARLHAQRGGCCTVMPYFLPGGTLELPLTTIEDYTLLHILDDYSPRVWKQQIDMILQGHGFISFIVHPDYLVSSRSQDVYKSLLNELSHLQSDRGVWITLPGEVDRWWRQRSKMKLVADGRNWKIEGVGSERARVAHARLDGDGIVYEMESNR